METWLALVIFAELVMMLFIIWGFMHEDLFIKFEHNAWIKIKRFVRKSVRFIKAVFIALFVSEEEIDRRYNERRANF